MTAQSHEEQGLRRDESAIEGPRRNSSTQCASAVDGNTVRVVDQNGPAHLGGKSSSITMVRVSQRATPEVHTVTLEQERRSRCG